MIKYLLIILCIFKASFAASGQNGDSVNASLGYRHTPKGNLHMLIVFAGFKGAGKEANRHNWPWHDLPDWAKGDYNKIIDADTRQVGEVKNITAWFYKMSLGKFTLTGEIYSDQVLIKREGSFREMSRRVISKVDEDPYVDWSDFDNRQNGTKGQFPNHKKNKNGTAASGDGKIDLMAVIFRNIDDGSSGACPDASLGQVTHDPSGKSYTIPPSSWFYFSKIKNQEDPWSARDLFIHEISHALYNGTHNNGSNQVTGLHWNTNYGWGLTVNAVKTLNCANAWERWYLGWKAPKHQLKAWKDHGTYYLDDYITTGDAIRIKIPHTNQYLWLENHQMKALEYDRSTLPDDKSGDPFLPPEKGLAVYTAAMPDKDTLIHSVYNREFCNGFSYFHAGGHFDYAFDESPTSIEDWWGNKVYGMHKEAADPLGNSHPLTMVRHDFNDNGSIRFNSNPNNGNVNEHQEVLLLDGREVDGPMGRNMMFSEGEVLGIGSNPALINYPWFDPDKDKRSPIFLNNLSVKVLNVSSSGRMKLRIRFDDPVIDADRRWSGRKIVLRDDDVSTGAHPMRIMVEQGHTLTLARDQSPVKQKPLEVNGVRRFSYPTALVLEANTLTRLGKDAELHIKDGSTLIVQEGALLEGEKNARIVVEEGSYVAVDKDAVVRGTLNWQFKKGSKTGVHPDAAVGNIQGSWMSAALLKKQNGN